MESHCIQINVADAIDCLRETATEHQGAFQITFVCLSKSLSPTRH
jgi:hypothetical protein